MIKRFMKFGVVGGLGTIINLMVFGGLNEVSPHYLINATISFIVASLFNYILNNMWVFNDRGHHFNKILYVKFISVSIIALGINLITLFIMERFFMMPLLNINIIARIITRISTITNIDSAKIVLLFAQAIGIGTGMVFNFFGSNSLTFKKKN